MLNEQRQRMILDELKNNPDITVKELAKKLYVSEPTIRRDFTQLHKKGIITKVYGGAILNQGAADREIPFYLRENEKSSVKSKIAAIASQYVHDGMVVMLDGSTSAYHMVPFLAKKKDLIVITSGAKTAVSLAEHNIKTFCTGGQMIINSFSYVGKQAESFVENINADILFFSCHGLSNEGHMTDLSIEEANLRCAMFKSSKKKILLCDNSKIGKTYFYNMRRLNDIDCVISDEKLPVNILKLLNKESD